MSKKPNPWVDALKKKKAAVDLHPDVLRAVLKMNPDLRGGDRSTEEVAGALLADLPASKPGQAQTFSDGKLRSVFADMLTNFEQELAGELKRFAERRQALDLEEAKLKQAYVERVVSFLVEVQPGPLTETTRAVVRDHLDFFHRLGVEPNELARAVRQKSDEFKR